VNAAPAIDPGMPSARTAPPQDPALTTIPDLRETLREYYRQRSVRHRMREFLGGTRFENATAAYITATDGLSDFADRAPPSSLAKYLDAGLEVDRSLWDSHSLLVDLDMEYTNFDQPAAAWTNREHAFEVQIPAVGATLRTLERAGIDPLVLVSGRGFHMVWSIDRESAAFRRLASLGHVNAGLAARYAQARSPEGATISPELGHAYAGLGMLAEFIGHCVLAQAAGTSPVPIEMTAIEVGPGQHGREIVSFDVSEYGDPFHLRHVRLPFSVYLKPRQLEWTLGEAGVRGLLPIFEVPLAGMTPHEAIAVARSADAAVRLSREKRMWIPDRSGQTEALLDHYEASELGEFHRKFYRDAGGLVSINAGAAVAGAPPCFNWLLDHPNDWLLRPAVLQHVARVLTALGWSPHSIACLVYGCYEKDLDWGRQWLRLDPLNRAMFYTRLFCGMIATGMDRLIDMNCVSHREKGYCVVSDCPANLADWRDRLLERRKLH